VSIVPDWLEQKAKAAEAKQETRQKAEVVQLPLWTEVERAIPNHLARSSLFAPIARGRRKYHDKQLLVSRADVKIYHTGKQLDEADCDVAMQLFHIARQHPLGDEIPINRAEVLKAIGRDTGKQNYLWLHESIRRLHNSSIEIETLKPNGKGYHLDALHIVDGFSKDSDEDVYYLRIDKRWIKLFSNAEFSLVDWQKRFLIGKRVDLAKRLQRLVATSADKVQRHSLDYLKDVCCHDGRMRDFKTALMDALDELERLHIIKNPKIETSSQGKEQAYWQRIKE
jgi:hypothetical protein